MKLPKPLNITRQLTDLLVEKDTNLFDLLPPETEFPDGVTLCNHVCCRSQETAFNASFNRAFPFSTSSTITISVYKPNRA